MQFRFGFHSCVTGPLLACQETPSNFSVKQRQIYILGTLLVLLSMMLSLHSKTPADCVCLCLIHRFVAIIAQKRTKLHRRQPSRMENWNKDRPSASGLGNERKCVRVSPENWFIAMLPLRRCATERWRYNKAQYMYTFASRLASFIHILFRKVHPNGMRVAFTHDDDTTYCAVYCVCVCVCVRLPAPTGWKYFSCFWRYFSRFIFVFSRSLRFFWCARAQRTTQVEHNMNLQCAEQRWAQQTRRTHKKSRFKRRIFIAHFWSLVMLCVCAIAKMNFRFIREYF